ncbi:MAG: TsaD/Kae1/Qri7 protein, required for threonylcarbamoyladenosine t(6)A37 formation in tRNA [Candidatus Ozemobacter sibiricus]|jgi:N6-L-threonylcarbamoyladenine synthase|uniref:tRNA N6-adenosine threonylcarbamoyltransferase n=1 Tax=Candidatus Ozemobacter sibiricus TaxID=2268124 RepID=A0A367ZRV0_9BACT|nr:MAG: TsaD/Kae1/Qri7 protein, required for threonylcarbamoyladenosine t(6)A37 formation in tRNA [Candidatus Ozemobacter sibiricus]
MITLGIESSCDDTSIALVEDGWRVRASLISSQIEVHRRFGGVVPEVAARKHYEAILPVLREALGTAGLGLGDLGQIACTVGPGLLGPLLVGLSTAKGLALALELPFIPVHHLEAHLAAAFLAREQEPAYPYVGLIVSGGHATLVLATGPRQFTTLGRTADDAPGELLDKIARHLGLGYPGGPVIQKTGAGGDPARYPLPRPLAGRGYGFSFSGLKTAVLHVVRDEGDRLVLPDLCASLQAAVRDTLCGKLEAALVETGVRRAVVAGGVAANAVLRAGLDELAGRRAIDLLIPPIALCTDNAAMVAAQGFHTASLSGPDPWRANACADWAMGDPFPVL